ncbi:hypothetical protein CLOM_g21070 [Closterium sp. NIES-68]|nr:hypothetical protein CLOM_g21070 [Closterium sp. NIES-68]GJP85780.1 hypothetical protein CLOP_g15879 [Closterium sp. NIES-67]
MGGPSTEDEMCIDYLVYYPARPGKEMNACFNFCADSTTMAMDPTSRNLSTFYVCGMGESSLIPSLHQCQIDFGTNKPLSVLNGCPAQTQASLAGIPPTAISAPLQSAPPSPPATALPPPATTASTPNASGKAARASVASITEVVVALLCSFLALVI